MKISLDASYSMVIIRATLLMLFRIMTSKWKIWMTGEIYLETWHLLTKAPITLTIRATDKIIINWTHHRKNSKFYWMIRIWEIIAPKITKKRGTFKIANFFKIWGEFTHRTKWKLNFKTNSRQTWFLMNLLKIIKRKSFIVQK